MKKDIFTFIVGGKAGEGVKKAGAVAASLFVDMGRHVFQMDDYMSLIRGGHNFSAVSTAKGEITSHYMKADLVVVLDQRAYDMHRHNLSKDGILVYNSDVVKDGQGIGLPLKTEARKFPNPGLRIGVSGIAVLAAALDLGKDRLKEIIGREYPRDLENNIAFGEAMYDLAYPEVGARIELEEGDKKLPMLYGNHAIALGAAAGGLDIYFAYPMTPASSVLHYLASKSKELGVTVVHPENEIGVMNMAVGAAAMGARTMVGSSGGGFALMEEALSLAGMAEVPVLCVLSSRPGPSTGVPTYTEQGDLRFALNQGHGEFPRIVASPGTVEGSYYLAAEMLEMVWRFQTPGILLTEKHMSESSKTVDIDVEISAEAGGLMHEGGEYRRYLDTENGLSPMLFPPSKELINWNSYESDEMGVTTEDPAVIEMKHDKRRRKQEALESHMRDMATVNHIDMGGGDGGPVIFTYGSTLMSVLEALRAGDIKATVVQPIYLEPFPVWEMERYKGRDVIVVEQSVMGTFATILREKTGIEAKAVIRKYDGRPFDPVELAESIREVA